MPPIIVRRSHASEERSPEYVFPAEEPFVPKEFTTEETFPVSEKDPAPLQKTPPVLIINYPQTGRKPLPVGSTSVNVKQRKATLPDGTVESIYAARSMETCRSFLMYVDQPVDIRLTRHGALLFASGIFPEWTRITDAPEFGSINITTTGDTLFYIAMSEDPNGVPMFTPDHRLGATTSLGYNAADDLVSIKKIIDGVTYLREIDDPDVLDTTVDRWVEYGEWVIE